MKKNLANSSEQLFGQLSKVNQSIKKQEIHLEPVGRSRDGRARRKLERLINLRGTINYQIASLSTENKTKGIA